MFSIKKSLENHIEAVHGGKKPYRCEICDQCFTQSSGLSGHVERVHEEKKIESSICSAMISIGYFKVHMYSIHEGKKPFNCDICESSFTESTKLLHMCFDRFLLAFESRDLSQADKSFKRVSSFPRFNF